MAQRYAFGADFERAIVRLCLLDPTFVAKHHSALRPEWFTDERNGGAVEAVLQFWERYGAVPSREALAVFLSQEKDDDGEAHRYLTEEVLPEKGAEGVPDAAFIKEQTIEFARNRAVEAAIVAASKLVQDGRYDDIRDEMARALAVGVGDDADAYDFFEQAIARIRAYGEGQEKVRGVPTGIAGLDEMLDGGGLGPGELGLVLAPPGFGKTALLMNMGYGALIHGLRVAHFTFEVSLHKLARRYDLRITGMNKEQMRHKQRSAALAILDLSERLQCNLQIRHWPTASVSVKHLRACLTALAEGKGFRPDLILVDYGEIMSPERKRDDRWQEIDETYEALRGLAGEWQAALWTGSQTGAAGFSAKTIDMRHTGGSHGKDKTADVIVSINPEPRLRDDLPVRLVVVKNREEASGGEVWTTFRRSTQTYLMAGGGGEEP